MGNILVENQTRMHSSRMRTTRSSSCCGVCLSACWDTAPWVWAWRPPWVFAWRPPRPDPSTSPWVWAWRPPWPDPSTSLLGVGLETCKACWDTTPQRPAARHAGIPPPSPVNRIRDTCKNITLPQLRCGGKY